MTRIALIPSLYPPYLGGVEELSRHLALHLVAAGNEVEIWSAHPSDMEPETVEIRDGLIVRRFPMPLPAVNWQVAKRTALLGSRTMFSLAGAAARFRPDVLHVQCFGPNGAYATAAARLLGIPLVLTLQGETIMDDHNVFDFAPVFRGSLRIGLRVAAAVTACSAFTLADAEDRFGLPLGTGTVIPNGVDLTVDRPGPEAPWPGRPAAPYLFALGRMVEKKGFDLLIAAYAGLGASSGRADLVIAGAGDARPALERQVADLGIADRVHFVGRLDRDQVAAAMAGAVAFVMPSRLEPFGIVSLEGWRAGTAVVATNRGGAPEFIEDGRTGVLVDPFDTSQFTRALDELLSDEVRRSAIAAAGAEAVEAYSWEKIAARYEAVYDTVVRRPSKTTRSTLQPA